MGFPEPKAVKAPPLPDPAVIPDVSEETGDTERRKRFHKGRAGAFITGDLAPEVFGKMRLLGGNK